MIIKLPGGKRFRICEHATLADMQRRCPRFFAADQRKFFGDTGYTVYRGQLLVAATMTYSTGERSPRVIPYLFLLESLDDPDHQMPDLFPAPGDPIAGDLRDIDEAKLLIDSVLAAGTL